MPKWAAAKLIKTGIRLLAQPRSIRSIIDVTRREQQQGLNPPQIVLEQVSAYKTEMDSIAQFVEQECDIDPESRYSASKLYEAYRHYCQAIGRKPQSTNAFKKALDKLTGVYQSRTASGMQWHGIRPLVQF